MGCRHPGNDIDGAAVAVATITAHHQGPALHTREGAEDRLDKTFEVMRLFKLLGALAQSRGARLLVLKRFWQLDLLHGELSAG